MLKSMSQKGIFWVLLWVLLFSTAVTFTKLLGDHIPTVVIIFVRSFFGFCFVLPVAVRKGLRTSFTLTNKKVMVFRMITYFLAIACTYYAYRNLPLATATSIGFSGPLFITTFALLLLGERFSMKQWAFLLLGYVGVLVITNPGSIQFEVAIVSSILANTLAGLGINLTKILTRTEDSLTIVLYGGVSNIVLSLLLMPYFGLYIPTLNEFFLLMIVGSCGVFSGFAYIQAVKYSSPTFVAPFEYTRLLYAIPVGYFFFSEEPTFTSMLGACIIVVAVYQLTMIKVRQEKQK